MSDSDARAYLQQASDFMVNDRFREAITCYESALDTLERIYGENDPHLADCLQELAEAYECGSRLRDAVRVYNRCLSLNEATVGANTPIVAETLYKLTQINEKLDRPSEALGFARRAQETANSCLADGDPLKRLINARYRHLAGLAGGFDVDLEPGPGPEPEQQPEQARETDGEQVAQREEETLAPLVDRTQRTSTEGTARRKRYGTESLDAPVARPAKLIRIISLTGLLALVVLVAFFFTHKTAELVKQAPPVATPKPAQKPSAIGERYRSPDNQKEVCLWSNNEATIRTAGSAQKLPFTAITPTWEGLGSAMLNSLTERQIWAVKKESQLKLDDGTVLYAADGPEAQIITKMRRIGALAQAYYLRAAEYPKMITLEMMDHYEYNNPVDNKVTTVPIRTIPDSSTDCADTRALLESGKLLAEEKSSEPGQITGYTAVVGKTDAKGEQLRGVKFFVRGCDRYGAFISSGQNGRTYVIAATNELFNNIQSPSAPTATGTDMTDSAKKPKRLWLVSNFPFPLILLHYALPLSLIMLSLPTFMAATMQSQAQTKAPQSGANRIQLLAIVLLVLACLAAAIQIFI